MDGKAKIIIDTSEEECVDLSISYTSACSIYVVLIQGLGKTKSDIVEMTEYTKKIKELTEINEQEKKNIVAKVGMDLEVAELALKNGTKLMEELARVIEELDPENRKKSLIIKPDWSR